MISKNIVCINKMNFIAALKEQRLSLLKVKEEVVGCFVVELSA